MFCFCEGIYFVCSVKIFNIVIPVRIFSLLILRSLVNIISFVNEMVSLFLVGFRSRNLIIEYYFFNILYYNSNKINIINIFNIFKYNFNIFNIFKYNNQ